MLSLLLRSFLRGESAPRQDIGVGRPWYNVVPSGLIQVQVRGSLAVDRSTASICVAHTGLAPGVPYRDLRHEPA
jgi:hypothetical protein